MSDKIIWKYLTADYMACGLKSSVEKAAKKRELRWRLKWEFAEFAFLIYVSRSLFFPMSDKRIKALFAIILSAGVKI